MRTIGRHWPATAPRGDYPAYCDCCCVKWRRSQLRRDPSGKLRCPDWSGKDEVTLARENAEGARAAAARRAAGSGMPKDGRSRGGGDP